MLYDPQGRMIEEPEVTAPRAGLWCAGTTADLGGYDVSRNLTPARVDRILTQGNAGDIQDQSELAAELEEKSWDIAHALQTRRLAVLGCAWKVNAKDAGDGKAANGKAEEIAAAFEAALRNIGSADLDGFGDLVGDMLGALLPGFAASEIIWGKGGELLGFKHIEQRFWNYRDGKLLLIPQDQSAGVEMPPAKLVFRRARVRAGLACRDGLLRPLVWLHCFSTLNVKDLLGFIERYGMPFVTAKVDDRAWKEDRNKIQALIKNFGPSGGGVFTRAIEMQLLEASNSGGDVYFKLLEYCRLAIEKLILGQNASSGASSGLSGGDAQSAVRQDILEADCAAIADCVNARVAKPWTLFNYGPNAPVPALSFDCEPPEDLQAFATVVKTLFDAGLEVDEVEMSEHFGFKLTRKAPPPPPPASSEFGVRSSELSEPGTKKPEPAEGGAAAPGSAEPQLGSDAVDMAADSPSSLQPTAYSLPPDPEDRLVTAALEAFARDGAEKWSGTLLSGFATEALAGNIENTVYAAAANGAASKSAELNSKEGKAS